MRRSLLALNGQTDLARVCPLSDKSGHWPFLACEALSANDPKRTFPLGLPLERRERTIDNLGFERPPWGRAWLALKSIFGSQWEARIRF
jgi:hypothetical protein